MSLGARMVRRSSRYRPACGGGDPVTGVICPAWAGAQMTIDPAPLTIYNAFTSPHHLVDETFSFPTVGDSLQIALCMERAIYASMSLVIGSGTNLGAYQTILQTDNKSVSYRCDSGGGYNNVTGGGGYHVFGGAQLIDLTITRNASDFTVLAAINTGAASASTYSWTSNYVNLSGGANRIYVGPGTNGLGAITSFKYRWLP